MLIYLAIVFFFLVLGWSLPPLSEAVMAFFYHKIKFKSQINRSLYITYNQYLLEYNQFYTKLSFEGRAKFLGRVRHFIKKWEFEGRQGFEVRDQHKIKIAAAAAQLTFGFRYFKLNNTHKIIIYPDVFYSKLQDAMVRGLAFGNGILAFSWKCFDQGFQNPNDRMNLGLHEMAHALKLNMQANAKMETRFSSYLHDFLNYSWPQQIERIANNKRGLRAYANTNQHEFFAVAAEHFFEDPHDFLHQMPEVYVRLCVLLNLNPLNDHHDFELTHNFIENFLAHQRQTSFKQWSGFTSLGKVLISGRYLLLEFSFFSGFILYAMAAEPLAHNKSTFVAYILLAAAVFSISFFFSNKHASGKSSLIAYLYALALGMGIGSSTLALVQITTKATYSNNFQVTEANPQNYTNVHFLVDSPFSIANDYQQTNFYIGFYTEQRNLLLDSTEKWKFRYVEDRSWLFSISTSAALIYYGNPQQIYYSINSLETHRFQHNEAIKPKK